MKTSVTSVLLGVGIALIVGCSSPSATEKTSGMALQGPSDQLGAFKLERADRTRGEIATDAASLASVFAQKVGVPVGAFLRAVDQGERVPGSVHAKVNSDNGFSLSYFSDNNMLIVFKEEMTRDTLSKTDVGFDHAKQVFDTAFQFGTASRAFSSVGMDASRFQRSAIIQGEGSNGEAPVERVTEYIFTVPRKINGIEVFETGVEVFVHRSGGIARVKTYGLAVHSTAVDDGSETPTAEGYTFTRSVAVDVIDARVKSIYEDAQINDLGLRYWLPEGVASDIVEPQQMYFVVPTTEHDGEITHGRGFYVGYSVSQADMDPVVWPNNEIDPNDVGDPRP